MSKINNVFLFLYASLRFEPIDFILTFKSLGSQIYRHILKEYTVISIHTTHQGEMDLMGIIFFDRSIHFWCSSEYSGQQNGICGIGSK